MSKIGRKPIDLKSVKVEINNNEIHFKGPKSSGVYVLPSELKALLEENKLKITCPENSPENNKVWGLHRALLANKLQGAHDVFAQQLKIEGLGFKAVSSGKNLVFSLGYTHKIDFPVPQDITIDVDRTGQLLTVKGSDKEAVGLISSEIRRLRPPEPYKGTGVKLIQEVILRKAGKTKSA
jgi:large subunit ribosomal protein L6